MWATLQFKWIQLRYPVVCMALERLLFAGTLPVAAMILTWATLIAVGPSNAPFYQAALLSGVLLHIELNTTRAAELPLWPLERARHCEQPGVKRDRAGHLKIAFGFSAGLYYALATPVEASFELGNPGREGKGTNGCGKAVPEEARIQGSLEGFVAAALTVALPPLLYLVAHRHVIAQSQHLWGLLLLASAPLVLLTLLQVWRSCTLESPAGIGYGGESPLCDESLIFYHECWHFWTIA